MESLRTTIAYYDGKYIWTVDDVFGGLYMIDISNLIVSCAVSAMELYRYGVFEAVSVIEWEDCIIVIPKQIKQRWVFYDKITKEISHRKVIDINGHTPEVCVLEHFVCMPPVYEGEPFIVFDLVRMQISTVINNFYKGDVHYEIWRCFKKNGTCCVPLRGTRYLYAFSGTKYEKVQVNIEEVIGDASCAKEGYWILPQNGKYIYETDNNGNITEKVKLTVGKRELHADYFVRIISTDRLIFLIPCKNNELYVYRKEKYEFFLIPGEYSGLTNSVIYDIDEIPYWGYWMTDNKICFLPRRNRWVSFDLNTYKTTQKDVFLPGGTDYAMVRKCILRIKNHDIFAEETKESLSMYFECIGTDDEIADFYDDTVGKNIYNYICKL